MSSYATFAQFYDRLTENVDYEVRSAYISNFFAENGVKQGSILDLACGTGTIAKALCEKGYTVTGLDLSEEMLNVAVAKNISDAFFVKGDMTAFELPSPVDGCICSMDAINHLTDYMKVCQCFACVYKALKEQGIFVFDVNTVYKHREVLFNNTFAFEEEDFFLCWDNEYEENDTVAIYLDFFVKNGEHYDRLTETFKERAYTLKDLQEALSYSGFRVLGIYDELTLEPPREDSERVYFVCKKEDHNGKSR